jgi:hypothetical protein
VYVVGLAVKLRKFGVKLCAHVGKDCPHRHNMACGKYPASVFGRKDKMDMEEKYAMSAAAVG